MINILYTSQKIDGSDNLPAGLHEECSRSRLRLCKILAFGKILLIFGKYFKYPKHLMILN